MLYYSIGQPSSFFLSFIPCENAKVLMKLIVNFGVKRKGSEGSMCLMRPQQILQGQHKPWKEVGVPDQAPPDRKKMNWVIR